MSDTAPRLSDPGLPEHVHRQADTDPVAAKKAERQVAILFTFSALGTILFIYSYIWVRTDRFIFIPVMGDQNAAQLGMGIGLTISLLFIGLGAIHWVKEQGAASGLGRRSLIKRSLGLSLGLIGLSPLLLLRDLGPLPKKSLEQTSWKTGTRLVIDPSGQPIKPSDLEVGAVAQVLPELAPGQERTLENVGKDAVLLIRLRPEEFELSPERLSWTYQGIIAFSKICTHMGCAVALYEQQTKHLLCPCHQSTFDVPSAAKVIFGPAARPLPQLAITVDSEGYLVAQKPFSEPVGPSFWERSS